MINKQLNILFLASWYPNRVEPQDGNFVQRHALATAKFCKVAALHVRSVVDVDQFTIEKRWNQNILEVIVYFPKTIKILPFIKLQRYKKAHYLGYEAIVKEIGAINFVHLNVSYPAGIFAHLLKSKYQIPFLLTEHWTVFLDSNPHDFGAYQKYIVQQVGREASAICPVSEDLAKAMKAKGIQNNFQVIPNVVDTDLFTHLPIKQCGEKIKILHVSTLFDPHKNISGILRTIAKLSEQRNDFEIKIVGNGFVEEHQAFAKKLNIPDGIVEFQGETPYEEIAHLMQKYDLFLLFSNYENLPCVISEAHVAGLPVLASNVGGISEMIDDQNGVLTHAKDESLLLSKLNHLMDHIDEYDRKEIRRKAIERYSFETVGQQYFDLYTQYLNPKSN